MDSQEAVNAREWQDQTNWRSGFYFSKRDSRLWVPKAVGSGSTFNFAHPGVKWAVACGLAVPVVLLGLLVVLGVTDRFPHH
jgi:uncharacterized membrane protein